jgi:hypothetical protein
MNKIMFALLVGVVATSAIAAESEIVLSTHHITIDGKKIALPVTKKADGSVCKSYVSSIETRHNGGAPVVKIDQLCENNSAAVR